MLPPQRSSYGRPSTAAFMASGVAPGDRVAVITGSRSEPLEVFLACAFSSALFVPLNPHLRGGQLEHQLRDADPAVVIVESSFAPNVCAALAAVGSDARVVVLKAGHWATGAPRPATEADTAPLAPTSRPRDPLAVLYTSGTTGPSKGVLCPQGQFFWWAVYVGEYLELTREDVLYTTLPLYHVNALSAFLQAMAVGATFVLGERFSASRFVDELRDTEATVTYLLGAMVTILYSQPPSERDRNHRVRVALAPAWCGRRCFHHSRPVSAATARRSDKLPGSSRREPNRSSRNRTLRQSVLP